MPILIYRKTKVLVFYEASIVMIGAFYLTQNIL